MVTNRDIVEAVTYAITRPRHVTIASMVMDSDSQGMWIFAVTYECHPERSEGSLSSKVRDSHQHDLPSKSRAVQVSVVKNAPSE